MGGSRLTSALSVQGRRWNLENTWIPSDGCNLLQIYRKGNGHFATSGHFYRSNVTVLSRPDQKLWDSLAPWSALTVQQGASFLTWTLGRTRPVSGVRCSVFGKVLPS